MGVCVCVCVVCIFLFCSLFLFSAKEKKAALSVHCIVFFVLKPINHSQGNKHHGCRKEKTKQNKKKKKQ